MAWRETGILVVALAATFLAALVAAFRASDNNRILREREARRLQRKRVKRERREARGAGKWVH